MSFSLLPLKKSNLRDIDEKINLIKHALKNISTQDKRYFLSLLGKRVQDFTEVLNSTKAAAIEKDSALTQYDKFVKTLHYCVTTPQNIDRYISIYHNHLYHPVGVTEVCKPEPIIRYGTLGAVTSGAVLILASIPTFIINPLIGLILISSGLTLLAPGVAFLCMPEFLDSSAKKQEEKVIFEEGARLGCVASDLTYSSNDEEPNYMCP